jgi:hypothetical protein
MHYRFLELIFRTDAALSVFCQVTYGQLFFHVVGLLFFYLVINVLLL